MNGRIILTAEEMRAAEAAVVAAGTSVESLMERAGEAAAEAIWRFAGPMPALVLCGPGNNGGDGYVIARELARRGASVRVAAMAEPGSPAAKAARASWSGPVASLAEAGAAPLVIDALFGTGLTRPLEAGAAAALASAAAQAAVRVAVDLPSGAATDNGALLSAVPDYDLTVTFQTLKPSHLLQPAARDMGRLVVADIGIAAESRLTEIGRPCLRAPGAADHKYSRGYVAVLAGEMPGAAALTAAAALRAGAGYVRLLADEPVV
ncbi:MAG TPA: NAD(P)H-hydrate epimerase, partial [Allosphingosinicella sp.]|nr:NAD(P)H-hydrate epimerase [Allosphingosinicella sp.]